jgi:hypothetical protein
MDMNKELAKLMIEWLRGLGERVATEAPQIAAETLRWGMIENWILGSLFGVVAFCGIVTMCRGIRGWNTDLEVGRNYGDPTLGSGLRTVIGGLVGFLFSIFFVGAILDLIQIQIAPRLYLLSHLPVK